MLRIMMPGKGMPPTPDNSDPDNDGDNDLDPTQDTDQDQGSPGDSPDSSPSKRFSIDKVDQSIVGYMGPEYGPFICGKCEHFDGKKSCNIVSGTIDPNGCCNLFTPQDDDSQDQPNEENPSPDDESAEATLDNEPAEGE